MSQSKTKMTWAGQMAQSRTGQDKSPKEGRPAKGRTNGSSEGFPYSTRPNLVANMAPRT